MSSLGEKLRQARETRGVSISEIADQTRVSSYYLEAIESDDYRVLPGGIFNKGFVKAFAKYVGIDEQEALQDYAKLIAIQGDKLGDPEAKMQRPEVLTDSGRGSMLPTLIFAAVILGLMTWGILAAVSWYNERQLNPTAASNTKPTNSAVANSNVANTNSAGTSNTANSNVVTTVVAPVNGELNVQFKSISTEAAKPNITAYIDGKYESFTFQNDDPKIYAPQQGVKVRFSKYQAANLQLTINGKAITIPPFTAVKGNGMEFEINKENVAQIMQAGAITLGAAVPPANVANTKPQ
jgi:cytoskeletal protein RodZ